MTNLNAHLKTDEYSQDIHSAAGSLQDALGAILFLMDSNPNKAAYDIASDVARDVFGRGGDEERIANFAKALTQLIKGERRNRTAWR